MISTQWKIKKSCKYLVCCFQLFVPSETKSPWLPWQKDEWGEKRGGGVRAKALTYVWNGTFMEEKDQLKDLLLKLVCPCRILAWATDYKCNENDCSSVHDIPNILHKILNVTEFYSNCFFPQKCVFIGIALRDIKMLGSEKSKLALASANGTLLHGSTVNLWI